jgi:hypothetical protein
LSTRILTTLRGREPFSAVPSIWMAPLSFEPFAGWVMEHFGGKTGGGGIVAGHNDRGLFASVFTHLPERFKYGFWCG